MDQHYTHSNKENGNTEIMNEIDTNPSQMKFPKVSFVPKNIQNESPRKLLENKNKRRN